MSQLRLLGYGIALALWAWLPAAAQTPPAPKTNFDIKKLDQTVKELDQAIKEFDPAGDGEEAESVKAEEKADQIKARAIAPLPSAADYGKIRSLFYSQEEIRDIRLAVNTYIKRINNRDDLTFDEADFIKRMIGLKRASQTSRYYTYPQFFLDSLVYHGPENWVIWVNGQKMIRDLQVPEGALHVAEITNSRVTLEWKPQTMEQVMESWKQFPNNEIDVNQAQGVVKFTLQPNQTFSAYSMSILEGKVAPVTMNAPPSSSSETETPQEAPEPVIPEIGAPAANPDGAGGDNKGLPGLINSYDRIEQQQGGGKTP